MVRRRRGRPRRGGSTIARTIVGAHGGRLTAENNADGGATFRFVLPVDKAAAR